MEKILPKSTPPICRGSTSGRADSRVRTFLYLAGKEGLPENEALSFLKSLDCSKAQKPKIDPNGLSLKMLKICSPLIGDGTLRPFSIRWPKSAILKDGSYHADVRYMSEAASERLSQDINANPNDRFDYENYYDTFFSVNFTVGNYDFPLEFRPNYGGISILIPESRMPEFNAEITSKEIMIQSPNYANIQKNTTDYLTSVGLAEDVSIFSSAESYESQRNFAAMIKLFSTSFLILLTVISCANVFNVITTSLNMRKREFAVLRSVGMTVNKLFAMLCIENLRNGLLAILIGGISSLPLCYLIYKSIVVGAVIDFVFPLGAFVISSLAMFLIMFLTSLYGLWKIKNGDIIADVRNDFV